MCALKVTSRPRDECIIYLHYITAHPCTKLPGSIHNPPDYIGGVSVLELEAIPNEGELLNAAARELPFGEIWSILSSSHEIGHELPAVKFQYLWGKEIFAYLYVAKLCSTFRCKT